MTLRQIDQRLAAIEAALADEVQTCPTCEGWPSILVRFQDEHGANRNKNEADGWPVDATCPGCGRRAAELPATVRCVSARVVTFGTDERGPA